VRTRLAEHHLELDLDDKAKEFLIDKGYNPDFGARPLRRAIEHNVEDPLSEEILRGSFKEKHRIMVTVKEEADGTKHLYFQAMDKEEIVEPVVAGKTETT
jgi:ATP-dependent Clp protease ATP-binding subunit ClpC